MTHVLAFMAAGLVALAVPGPDFAVVVRNAVMRGRVSGIFTAFGIGTALLVHGTAATLGLSALLATSASAFTVVKIIGAIYLAWMGICALRSAARKPVAASDSDHASTAAAESRSKAYRQGALTNLLNPKAALFFLSFLPQFVPDSGSKIAWTGGFAFLMAVMSVAWFIGVSLVAARIKAFLRRPRVTRAFEGTTGGVFVGLAAKLALAHR